MGEDGICISPALGQQPRRQGGCRGNVATATTSPHSRCARMGQMHNSNPCVSMKAPPPHASCLSHDAVVITSTSCLTKRVCET